MSTTSPTTTWNWSTNRSCCLMMALAMTIAFTMSSTMLITGILSTLMTTTSVGQYTPLKNLCMARILWSSMGWINLWTLCQEVWPERYFQSKMGYNSNTVNYNTISLCYVSPSEEFSVCTARSRWHEVYQCISALQIRRRFIGDFASSTIIMIKSVPNTFRKWRLLLNHLSVAWY